MIERVNLREKLSLFDTHWDPKIVGELNGQHVKLVKFKGEFVWHHHEHEDELFLVVKGRFTMEFRDRHVPLEEGEFLIVPRGVEHRPVAIDEVSVMLFEPAGTLNTGDVRDAKTADSRLFVLWSWSRCCSAGRITRPAAASVTALVATSASSSRQRRPPGSRRLMARGTGSRCRGR